MNPEVDWDFARTVAGGEFDHFDDNFVIRQRIFRAGVTHQDWIFENAAINFDEAFVVLLKVGTNELIRTALDDF